MHFFLLSNHFVIPFQHFYRPYFQPLSPVFESEKHFWNNMDWDSKSGYAFKRGESR